MTMIKADCVHWTTNAFQQAGSCDTAECCLSIRDVVSNTELSRMSEYATIFLDLLQPYKSFYVRILQ